MAGLHVVGGPDELSGDWGGLVVFFGGTAWDGNRFPDQHIAERLTRWAPVLYVDPPLSALRAGGLRALRPRLERLDDRLLRLTPLAPPAPLRRGVRALTHAVVRGTVRRVLAVLGARADIVVVASLSPLLHTVQARSTVLYGTDDFAAGAELMGADARFLRARERAQLREADVVLAVSDELAARWRSMGARVSVVENGVDLTLFDDVDGAPVAEDVALPPPVAGFVGHLSDRIDLSLLEAVAERGHSLLLVGPRQATFAQERIAGLLARPNVQWTGGRPFTSLPGYLRAMDVGLVPYADSAFNRASFPLKTLEYLAAAAGRRRRPAGHAPPAARRHRGGQHADGVRRRGGARARPSAGPERRGPAPGSGGRARLGRARRRHGRVAGPHRGSRTRWRVSRFRPAPDRSAAHRLIGRCPRVAPDTLLLSYATLLLLIPAQLTFGPLGSVGTPAGLVGLVALATWAAARALHVRQTTPSPYQPVRWTVGFFYMSVLASYVVAHRRLLSRDEGGGADRMLVILLAYVGVALVAADDLDRRRLERLVSGLVLLGAIVAVVGILQFATGVNIIRYYSVVPLLSENTEFSAVAQRSVFRRVNGTTSHPIEFSITLCMLLPLAVHRAFSPGVRHRLRQWVPPVLIATAIPMTLSRSGTLAVGVVGLILAAGWGRQQRARALVLAPVFVIALQLLIPGLLGTIRSLFSNIGNDPNIQGRTEDYAVARGYVSSAPWLGRGFGTFVPSQYQLLDNQYLGMLIKAGAVGLGACSCCSWSASGSPGVPACAQSTSAPVTWPRP